MSYTRYQCTNTLQESMRADYITNVENKLKRFSNFLADKPWSAGNEVRPLYPTSTVLGCVCDGACCGSPADHIPRLSPLRAAGPASYV